MDINPVYFPQVTNRESWKAIVTCKDGDTGELIDLTGFTFACEVRRVPNNLLDQSGYVPYYDYGSVDDAGASITLALGSGVTVVGLGQVQLDITVAQMRSLAPDTYSIALTAMLDDEARQVFLGTLPVQFGGVT